MTASADPPARGTRPALVGADRAGFLDAPGIEADVLFETLERVLSGLPGGAVLTVYTDDPAVRAEATDWCAGRDVELLAVISHEHHGTTLAFRRPLRPGDPQPPAAGSGGQLGSTEPPRHPRLPPKT